VIEVTVVWAIVWAWLKRRAWRDDLQSCAKALP
jgi:hypothetical protein